MQEAIAEAIDSVVIPAAEKLAGRELAMEDYDLLGRAEVTQDTDTGDYVTKFRWDGRKIAGIVASIDGVITARSFV